LAFDILYICSEYGSKNDFAANQEFRVSSKGSLWGGPIS